MGAIRIVSSSSFLTRFLSRYPEAPAFSAPAAWTSPAYVVRGDRAEHANRLACQDAQGFRPQNRIVTASFRRLGGPCTMMLLPVAAKYLLFPMFCQFILIVVSWPESVVVKAAPLRL